MATGAMTTLTVAICGGGIASLCLAQTLCQLPHFRVKIFEASDALREDGTAIGLGSNAQEALALMSPKLRSALDEAGGTRMEPSVRIMMGTGPDSGRHVGDIDPVVPQIVVHRGRFLHALRRQVPDGVLELGKKLVEVGTPDNTVRLTFHDGTFYEADALIGCDGINSITRKTVLGAGHPAAGPVYVGGYNHRIVVPLATAVSAFGPEYCNLRTQHGWVGKDGFLLTDFVDNGDSMQVIAGWSTKEPWPYQTPFLQWSKDHLRQDLANWGSIGQAMVKVFTAQPALYAAGSRIHLETPAYAKGQVCIAGDAAHTFPPFQGAGAGQAIEDALILSTVLGRCSAREDLAKALGIYDKVRRPRRSEVAKSSTKAALLFTGRAPDIGLDIDRIGKELPSWGSNIYDYNLKAAQQETMRLMSVS